MRGFPFLVVVLGLILAGPASAARILVLGDSISAAYGLALDQGWVAQLSAKLAREAPGRHQVINVSISGETASGGRRRLPALLGTHRPELVLIELGGNDALRGRPPAAIAADLRALIQTSRSTGAKVLLVGMRIPPNYGRAYSEAFAGLYPQLARSEQVPLVPFLLAGVGGVPGLMQADGIHPTAAAQSTLLANVWPALQRLL